MAVYLRMVLLVTVLSAHIVRGRPTGKALNINSINGTKYQENGTEAAEFLVHFGCLSSSDAGEREVDRAVKNFQRCAGLNVTGELDAATIQKMREPRCGVTDNGCCTPQRRVKRYIAPEVTYVLGGSKWEKNHLTFFIRNFPSSMGNNHKGVRDTIKAAAEAWSKVSLLTISEAKDISSADIVIQFVKGHHGNHKSFDGPDSSLGHARDPVYGGDVCFNDYVKWTVDSRDSKRYTRYDLLHLALHELGHALGLGHSNDNNAVMAPFYKRSGGNARSLTRGDIDGIQKLYGPSAWSLCLDSSIDAMLTLDVKGEKKSYAFKGDYVWTLTNTSVDPQPSLIKEKWVGLPGHLDAAVPSKKPGGAYFFKGSQFWKMTNLKIDAGFPQPISEGFKGIPDNLDAALRWVRNGKIYFFKGSEYWQYDDSWTGLVDGYPKTISERWDSKLTVIDGAFTWTNNKTYFFEGTKYYRFDDKLIKVHSGYPVSIGKGWFNCSN